MNEVRWERMFPGQLEASFAQCPLVYFTYGMCEPHGPHCGVGLDGLKAHAIGGERQTPPSIWAEAFGLRGTDGRGCWIEG